MRFRRPAQIHGHDVPGPRFTGWAAVYFVFFFALPLLVVCAALDVLVSEVFGVCTTIACWF